MEEWVLFNRTVIHVGEGYEGRGGQAGVRVMADEDETGLWGGCQPTAQQQGHCLRSLGPPRRVRPRTRTCIPPSPPLPPPS